MSRRELALRAAAAGLVILGAATARAVRDPWFPDGPVEAQIPHGVLLPAKLRTREFPLKTARTLHSDAEIARARENVARYAPAKAIADHILEEADYWKVWSDQALRDLVTSAEVPRSDTVCDAGCPVHGTAIYEVNGGSTYPWIVDPKQPFKVKCPIGGETYPDNDYGAYYRSGFKDRSTLKGKIVDDGWGWVGPDGRRYWFVAYANQMLWQRVNPEDKCIDSAISFLGRAYVLTGDRRYAHKAAVLLRRVAEVYPAMNYEQQSRAGELMGEQGTRYPGKIVNLIWESWLVAPQLSEAYDNIWETIDGDTELQRFYHQSGEQIRSFIEANYLEESIDCYFSNKMRGNYGTHQAALLQLAVVRQHGDNARYINEVLHRPEGHMLRVGFDYGLYNLVFRDGNPHESPDYNFAWMKVFARSATLLPKLGYDLVAQPRFKRMFDAPLDFIAIGELSPAIGDSKTRYAPLIPDDALTYRRGLDLYGDRRYADFLAGIGATGAASFTSYESLFEAPLPAAPKPAGGRVVPPQPSRVLPGYGYAFLDNGPDTCSLGLFYGPHVAHYHFDRLTFDLFANGQAMTPSLGYPDAANEFNPGIFTWSKTTIAHNSVTVDARRQPANPPGSLRLFADGPFARAVTADASGTYPQTSLYSRTLVMVDLPKTAEGKARCYVVDFFDVTGGRQHDYSLHGPTGTFTALGGTWTEPAPGTLAGPDVPVGALYDDPVRGAPGFHGSYLNYAGSGFQHLTHVQRLTADSDRFVAQYVHDRDSRARIRIRVLPQPGQQLLMADARVSPIKFPERVKYLIARRKAAPGQPDLDSTFSAVLEPYAADPSIVAVRRMDLGHSTAVRVARADGQTDVVIHQRMSAPLLLDQEGFPRLTTDATVAVATFDREGRVLRLFLAGGRFVEAGGHRLEAEPLEGRITAVDPVDNRLRVRFEGRVDPDALVGRVVTISGPGHETADTVVNAQQKDGEAWIAVKDDLRIGRLRVSGIEGDRVATKSGLRIAVTYRGATLCDGGMHPVGTVADADGDGLRLLAPPQAGIAPGEDAWLVDAAAGEAFTVPGVASWSRAENP